MRKIGPDQVIFTMGKENRPALWIDSGEILEVETHNWFSDRRDYARELAEADNGVDINPATGPVGVTGATRNDILKIDILEINLEGKGMMFTFPGSGLLGEKIKRIRNRVIAMKEGYALFNKNVRIPLQPMIGVIGTSPEEDVPCFLPGRHGGNMDTRLLGEGSSIYLPVYTEGGGFAVGDLHGVMADGEVSEWGLETSGKVKLRARVIKNRQLEWPALETATDCYLIVSHVNLEEAIREAVRYAVRLIRTAYGLSFEEAVSLVSLIGNIEICQVVNPVKTVRIRFSRDIDGVDLLKNVR